MRRSDTIKRLRKTHGEMRPLLIIAGIEAEKVDQFLSTVDDRTIEEVEAYHVTLTEFRASDDYKNLHWIYHQRAPHWWENIKALGETDLREQKLLRDRSKPVRAAWRKLHAKKVKSPKQDATEQPAEGSSV